MIVFQAFPAGHGTACLPGDPPGSVLPNPPYRVEGKFKSAVDATFLIGRG